ncbi:MAG: hypothetical protein M0Z65_10355 [Firmicutes bacterium]|uniref:Uncharacterized protein n=1 Tax=Melghirimyces thermohalophilus TaxID=1236220 RepID=A0A1G6KNR0_9BACL|nr:hypothetical protein [Melghirimyces thermohalophilus]MDA8353562.1 hypothetical protein [Bacillota bacterium]SDC32175.1 hypothetical protein SAMN04488112_10660 [Melghirimyces thermohalophilus]
MNLYIVIPLIVCILSLIGTIVLGRNQERESKQYSYNFGALVLIYVLGISFSALAVAIIFQLY